MPKIPGISSKKLIHALLHAGFMLDHTRGSHHVFYHVINKKRIVVPFHRKDLPKGTVYTILKEAGLSPKDVA